MCDILPMTDIFSMDQQQKHSKKNDRDTDDNNSSSSSPSSTSNKKKRWRKPANPSFLTVLADSMNPQSCWNAYTVVDDDDAAAGAEEYCVTDHGELKLIPMDERLDKVLPDLVEGIQEPDSDEHRVHCLQQLLAFVDSEHAFNRTPLVCSQRWNMIQILANCLNDPTIDTNSRKLVCKILNDLSIPFDNKAIMVLGPHRDLLLSSLLRVVQHHYPESCYWSCACLMNLSILDDAKLVLMNYELKPLPDNNPISEQTRPESSTEQQSSSLLSIFESMMSTYIPLLASTDVVSVESLAVRWATGLFRNLATVDEHAMRIAQTEIPLMLSQYLDAAFRIKPLCKWTTDSLEDLALGLLGMLVRMPETRTHLEKHHDAEIKSNLKSIANDGQGIHSMRAKVISKSLGGAVEIL